MGLRVVLILAALLLGACGSDSLSAGGHQPTYGDLRDPDESACSYDADVYEYCGGGKSSGEDSGVSPDRVTFFDGIDKWNEIQVAKYQLPSELLGTRLQETTAYQDRACGKYSKGDSYWNVCRDYGSTTKLYVASTGTR